MNRPKLTFIHANAKGTGAKAEMTLHPAHVSADGFTIEGCIMLKISNQIVSDEAVAGVILPKFDDADPVIVKLCFNDICEILRVLRGEVESICDGKGLYHCSAVCSTVIRFRHMIEPCAGYVLEVDRRKNDGDARNVRITFTSAEALGIYEAFTTSIGRLVFGDPIVQ